MKQLLPISIFLFLTACSNGEPLPTATGPWFALNKNQWTPTSDETKWIKEQLPERAYADK